MGEKDSSHADTVELDVFIVNKHTKEVHHKNFETGNCQLDKIEEAVVAQTLAEARRVYEADPCYFCFQSRR